MSAPFKLYRLAACCGVMALWALSPAAAGADQIIAITDAHGHKVYVNTGDAPAGFKRNRASRSAVSVAPPAEIQSLVDDTGQRHRVDPQLIHAIIQVESAYNPNAVSSKGAMGLMQLIPATADRFGVSNPFNARQNIEGGVTYLKYLLNLFDGDLDLSLAAYNAGEHRVERSNGVPEISETQKYVKKVEGLYQPASAGVLESSRGRGIASKGAKKPPRPRGAPIYRYVDSRGVAHYTNGDGL
jgi:soluble lytic murein transglycosylase-like protein